MKDPVELLQELLRFDTTNPPGNELACVEYVRGLVEGVGIETQIVARDAQRPNLLARLAGRGEAPPLLLYGHVDVVPTAGQDWSRDPFGGELVEGIVWGRGALDMKGGVAMLVSAFLRAAADGLRPAGDIVLCVLSDEEGGGDFGARFLCETHPELFTGIRHALGEFGGFPVTIGGRRFYWIQVAEKQISWLRARVRGRGGHGAFPHSGGTMRRLADVLRALDEISTPVHVTDVFRSWVEPMAAEAPELRPVLDGTVVDDGSAVSAFFAAALRNTVNATLVRGGTKINVIPAEVELELDGRLLPGFAPDDLIAEVREIVGDDVELEVVRHDAGPAHTDLSQLDLLVSILRELDPDAVPVPFMQVGVTDARFFSRIGIQTYGFLPLNLPPDLDLTKLIHAADERVPAECIEFGTEGVYRVLERYRG